MVSGSGRKVFQPGEVLTASNVQNYLQDQAVMVFAGTAARGTALGAGTVTDGMMSYLQDSNSVEVYKTSGTAIAGWEAPYPVSPNVVINGGFDIWQRGTSFTASNGMWTADRWQVAFDGTGSTRTVSQQTFTPGTEITGTGAPYFFRYAQSVAGSGGNYSVIQTKIEDVRTLAGQVVTLSFYAKASSNITLPGVSIDQYFGSGGSSDVRTSVSSNIAITTSWQRFTYTFTVPSISGKTIAASSLLQIEFYLPLNSTFTFDLWGVQVEAGQTATPFRRNANSIQGELAACQRYYYRIADSNAVYALFGIGQAYTSTNARIAIQVPSTMRVKPTALEWTGTIGNYTISSTAGWSTITSMNISAVPNSAYTPTIELVGTGFTNGQTFMLLANNNTSAYLGVTAEL